MDVRATLEQFHRDEAGRHDAARAVLRAAWYLETTGDGALRLEVPEDRDGEGPWLFATLDPPGEPHVRIDGRALVRGFPDDAAGVHYSWSDAPGAFFRRDGLPFLLEMAVALDLEDALLRPGPGQADVLARGPWHVLLRDGAPPASDAPAALMQDDFAELVPLFTAADRADRFLASVPALAPQLTVASRGGRELFAALAAREDHDGLVFDPEDLGLPRRAPTAAPAVAAGLAGVAGSVDSRPEACILPARTEAEVHAWLDLAGALPGERPHVRALRADGWCDVYEATFLGGARRHAFACTDAAAVGAGRELGLGASRILCAGLLAKAARSLLAGTSDDPAAWLPQDPRRARDAARWLEQMERLLEGDRIPTSAVRSVEGALFLRERPRRRTRAWIAKRLERARSIGRGGRGARGDVHETSRA